MDRLGIEYLTVGGLPPVEFVHLAADLGCRYVSLASEPGPSSGEPPRYPPYSLITDAGLRRRLAAALEARGVAVSLGEGFVVTPDEDVTRHVAALDVMAEVGVPRVNTVSFDRDRNRTVEQFGRLAELAAARGMATTMETSRGFVPHDLPAAVDVLTTVGRSDFRFLVDTMHVARSRATPADLAAIDPTLIGYVQLSDVPLVSTREFTYLDEALYERQVPGDGELPLAGYLAAVPSDVIVGLEVPNRAAARTPEGLRDHLERCVAAARRLLEP